MFKSNLMKKILVAAACLVALPAAAQIDIWDLSGGTQNTSGDWFDSLTVDGVGGNDLTITGWSNTASSNTIETGQLRFYSSTLGFKNQIEDSGSPDHSIDSYDGGYFDMVLLSFNDKVDLTRFDIGWAKEGSRTRADISVVAFTGSGNASVAGDTWGGIAGSGDWSTIGHYGNVDDYSYQTVTTEVESKYWLIGAYNSIFTNPGETFSRVNNSNDGFKLASVRGESTDPKDGGVEVPEPSSLAILALGLLALSSTRKKQQS